jgi:predicted RNase H-like nuclease (RuvC/YqgF family)
MAPREPRKAKAGAPQKMAVPAQLAATVERLESKVQALKDERAALKEQLKVARARVKELEAAQTDAVNRIDWVIDSLHNLLEEKA